MDLAPGHKQCTQCARVFPANPLHFPPTYKKPGELKAICKGCELARQTEKRKARKTPVDIAQKVLQFGS